MFCFVLHPCKMKEKGWSQNSSTIGKELNLGEFHNRSFKFVQYLKGKIVMLTFVKLKEY